MTELLNLVAKALSDALLKDVRIYDFHGVSPFYDYQIIASATNERQVHASIDRLIGILPPEIPLRIEGKSDNRWILFDMGSILVHVMHEQERSYYQIEKLFVEREQIPLESLLV